MQVAGSLLPHKLGDSLPPILRTACHVGTDFLTVLGAHEGEGLLLQAGGLGVAGSSSPFIGSKGQQVGSARGRGQGQANVCSKGKGGRQGESRCMAQIQQICKLSVPQRQPHQPTWYRLDYSDQPS